MPGEKPLVSDFTDHLSTIFPEVRLKSFLEMRGADGGPWSRICALPALWVGLLYDATALAAAWDEVKHWSLAERQQLRDAVPKQGLAARDTGRRNPARARRARSSQSPKPASTRARALNASGDNESGFLDPLRDIVAIAARRRPSDCSIAIMANGAATSPASMRKRASNDPTDTGERRTLYPPIEPYQTGMLDVGDGHQLLLGAMRRRPVRKPVVFLHGGPGRGLQPRSSPPVRSRRATISCCSTSAAAADRRRMPRSRRTPPGTWSTDIERLREMAGVDEWMVFGGSWGSTLALAYAQTHPDRVTELVLRGIFTFRQSELDWLYQ